MNVSLSFILLFLFIYGLFLVIDHYIFRPTGIKKLYYWTINGLTLVIAALLLIGYRPIMPTYPISVHVSQWVILLLGDAVNESTND